MSVVKVGAPVLGEARRAAEALMAVGVGQVWLFGSLARGEEGVVSDIDLVAVFDDLDYGRRWRVEAELRAAASAAAGQLVDVVVTDRPEWRIQRGVSASFASAIGGDLVLLGDRPAVGVDWGKEQSMATSNEELAGRRIDDVTRQLTRIIGLRWPSRDEGAAEVGGDRDRYERLLASRLIGLCEAAHLAVEGAFKAVGSLTGVEAKLLYTHDVGALADGLPSGMRDAMAALLASSPGLVKTTGYITMWRTKGVYRGPGEGMTAEEIATPAFASEIGKIAADAAVAAVDWLADRGVVPASAATLRAHAEEIRDHIAHIDLGTGELRPTL